MTRRLLLLLTILGATLGAQPTPADKPKPKEGLLTKDQRAILRVASGEYTLAQACLDSLQEGEPLRATCQQVVQRAMETLIANQNAAVAAACKGIGVLAEETPFCKLDIQSGRIWMEKPPEPLKK